MSDFKASDDEARQYAESIINTVREPVIVLNNDLRVISASRSFYQAFKVKPEESLGRLIYHLGNRQWDIPKLRQLLETLLPQKTIVEDYEVEQEFAELGRRTMLLNARQIQRSPVGESIILLAIEDITERKRVESLLSESEERYRRLFETANDGIMLLEKAEGKITHANPAIKAMLGYRPDELIGKELIHIGFPRDIGTIQEIFQTLERDGIFHYNDASVQAKSGQVVDTDIYMVDKASLVQCNIRDITERKRTAGVIERERNYLSAVIDNIGEAIVSCDAEGRIVRFNETARRLHGLPEQSIPSDQWAEHYNLYQADGITPLFKEDIPLFRALQGERVQNAEIVVAPKHSRPYLLVCNGQALTDRTGKIIGAVVAMHDITERKRMEDALRRERDLTQRYLDTTQTMMVALDAEGRITMINRSGCQLLGYTEEEILGRNWFETCLSQPEGKESVYPVFRRIMAGNLASAEYFENSVICRDGTQRLMGWRNAFLEDDEGRVVGALSSGEDITERKRAEQQLRVSEEKYRMLVENLNEVIYALDEKGAITYVSPTVESVGGYTPSELLGKQFVDFVHPDDRDTRVKQFHKTLSGIKEPSEYRFLTKDNQVLWIRTTARPLYKEGQVAGVQGVLADITERKWAEAERAEQHALIEAIYRNAPLIMMVLDGERRLRQVNGFAAQFAGRPTEEMLGLRSGAALRCLHAIDDPQGCGFGEFCNSCAIRNTVLDTLENGASHLQVEASFYFSSEDKTRALTLLVSTTPIIFHDENMALVTMMDITQRKQAEDEREKLQSQLLQAQKLESVGRLAGGVAHDFNNMLTIINGYAEMMTAEISPSEPLYDNALQIHEAGKRSAVIVSKLLAFARKQTISPEVMNLNDNVASMLKMLQRLIGENINLLWKPGQHLWLVKMDYSQLDQILVNLVVNASDAIAEIGKITIETKNVEFDQQYCDAHTGFVPGQFVMLAVSDSGCGMEKDVLDNLFEPFFTTKEIGKGTGLGLPTVYGIVKQNKGFINVYSEPGQGTTLRIYLPRHVEGAVALDGENQEQYPPGNGETVLVLEDEVSVLNLAKTMLEKLGYKVLPASSVHKALALVQSCDGAIDLLLTDVVMPERNGRDFANQVNSLYPGIKTLFMSGYTADAIVRQGILEDGVHYIQKPFSIKELAIKVRKAIEEESE
ncbi:MAG: PAS domain S-box protein [Desulfobacteraceae bacterium]|nr:PAS domain S-box protein [Desulfobacteraceae bacterium]MCF8036280.1 PAS domain S-box protein [Desulfobacteraceae bacterium]